MHVSIYQYNTLCLQKAFLLLRTFLSSSSLVASEDAEAHPAFPGAVKRTDISAASL